MEEASRTGIVSDAKLLEVEKAVATLETTLASTKDALLRHGLTEAQLGDTTSGNYIKTMSITVPKDAKAHVEREVGPDSKAELPFSRRTGTIPNIHEEEFEVQQVKAKLGEQVQLSDALVILANHNHLYIEGHAFKKEAPLLEKALKNKWNVVVEFTDDDEKAWPILEQAFPIEWLGNKVDEVSRTFPFYVPLDNQSRVYRKQGKTRLVWRFRPGQRVRLRVPVEKFENAIVLPRTAVVRDGPEAYIFRQNGNKFERKPVHILFEDQQNYVLDKKGIFLGAYVARNGAAAMLRVLKSQSGGAQTHHHQH